MKRRVRRRVRKTDDEPRVWLAESGSVEGGSVRDVFADEESAMRWLRARWEMARTEAAVTDAYWRKHYAEEAETETDPDLKAHYVERAADPDTGYPTDIETSEMGGKMFHASFKDARGFDWTSIHAHALHRITG